MPYARSSWLFAGTLAVLAACGGQLPPNSGDPGGGASTTDPDGGAPPPATTTDESDLTPLQQLGQQLFEDTTLSEPAGQSCASCHSASAAFTGNAGSPIAAVARGARGDTFGTRNAPTLMYAAFAPDFSFSPENEASGATQLGPSGGQFWDGRVDYLADQARVPLFEAREMNNASAAAVVAKVRDGSYAALAQQVYGPDVFADPDVAMERIAGAIAAYEQSARFRPFRSRFDDVLRGAAQFTDQEARGFALFRDAEKGNCITCHAGREDSREPSDWLFTNFAYETLGVPRNPAIPENADASHFDLGLCARPDLEQLAPAGTDLGRYCGAFKVPTLRNVAVTAPYMHNGYFATLRDVVAFYATRDTDPSRWYPTAADGTVQRFDDLPPQYHDGVNHEVPLDRREGEAPRLSDAEIDDIVAFLQTLTDR